MATAIRPFDVCQMGIESVKGTLVAATRKIVGDFTGKEETDFYRANYPRQYRATPGGAGTVIQKRFGIEVSADLSAEQVLWPLMTGIRGAVTPTGGGTAKTWVWTPQLSTSVITLDTATVELAHGDGTTNHYYAEAGYMFTTGFKISSAFGSVPKLSWTMAGRARQTDTITGALSAYSSLEELTHPLLTVYQDTTWAGLGGSQLTNIIRSVDFDCMTGLTPDYTADGRTDKDMTKHSVGSLGAKLNIVAELDANGLASSWTLYRSNSLTYIRLKWTGSAISGGGNKTVQIDGAYRFASPPPDSLDGEQRLVALQLEAVEDDTSSKILEFTAINTLSAIA